MVFCPIQGLEEILCRSTEDAFLATLKAARQEKYVGWELREVHRDQAAENELMEPRQFPFRLDGLLPWWDRANEFNEANEAEASRA